MAMLVTNGKKHTLKKKYELYVNPKLMVWFDSFLTSDSAVAEFGFSPDRGRALEAVISRLKKKYDKSPSD